jgi:hypothetical protein
MYAGTALFLRESPGFALNRWLQGSQSRLLNFSLYVSVWLLLLSFSVYVSVWLLLLSGSSLIFDITVDKLGKNLRILELQKSV